jgi:putative phosphoesterase
MQNSNPALPDNAPVSSSEKMRRILVLADTHNRLPAVLIEAASGADAIWHLGDVCRPEVLDPLKVSGRPLLIVRGNNDDERGWPMEMRLRFGPREFFLVHIPPRRTEGADVVLCGHTHVPRQEMVEGVWWLNPGSAGLPNKGAPAGWAWLEIHEHTGRFTWIPQGLAKW